jgi:hypothetical protein
MFTKIDENDSLLLVQELVNFMEEITGVSIEV